MDAVKKGGDRQELHEKIRVHSIAAAKRVKEEGLDNNLCQLIADDPAFGLTLEEISEASAQSSQRSDNGVFSPFEDSGDDDNGSSLPKLCIRSSSLQNVRMGKLSSEKGKSGEHVNRLKPSGGQLTASNRQRSAANLLMQRGAKPKHNTGIPMMTITEDD